MKTRIVLILDTYEALFRERSLALHGMPGLVDQWVRALVQEMTGEKFTHNKSVGTPILVVCTNIYYLHCINY